MVSINDIFNRTSIFWNCSRRCFVSRVTVIVPVVLFEIVLAIVFAVR